MPRYATAIEIFGKCFGSSCDKSAEINPDIIDPKLYSVEFLFDGNANEDVQNAVKSASDLWLGRENAVGGSAGLVIRAKGDYRRILASLYNQGYYAGSISIVINGQEAASINPGVTFPEQSVVSVSVDPGNVYRFGKFDITNKAPETFDEDDLVVPKEPLQNNLGDIAKARQVNIAGRLAVEEWREQGYPKARIAQQHVKAIHPENILNVRLDVDPGRFATYGGTSVEGTEQLDPEFVAYMTALREGEEYDPDAIERARKRLDRLDVFSVRKIEEADEIEPDGSLPFNVIVKEKKSRRIGVGGTFSTTDGAGFEAYWLHRNLFGKAERLRLEAEIAGIGETFNVEELDYRLGATFTKPGVFTPDTDWVSNIYAQREFNDTFLENSAGFSSVLNHTFSERLQASFGGFVEYAEFDDTFGNREFLTAGALGNVVYDARDNKLDPTKGYYLSADLKPFYEFRLENAGVRLEAEGRIYQAFDEENKNILAARVKLGSLVGIDRLDAPTNFLFFAGGGGSVRGFGFKNIGVVEANQTISGGRSLFETSVELRHRYNEQFGFVGFVDAGTVSENSFTDFSEELSVSAGAGIRYYTGIGPIRLDFAVPLNPRNGDPSFGIFAGIGQAF